jgi:hypothetical protein
MTEMMIMTVGLYVIGRCFSDFSRYCFFFEGGVHWLGGWWANTLFVLMILQCKFLMSFCAFVFDCACDLNSSEGDYESSFPLVII